MLEDKNDDSLVANENKTVIKRNGIDGNQDSPCFDYTKKGFSVNLSNEESEFIEAVFSYHEYSSKDEVLKRQCRKLGTMWSNRLRDIIINLEASLQAPEANITLSDMLKQGGFPWPKEATCCTQDADGLILWWAMDVEEVKKARTYTPSIYGMIAELGYSNQEQMDYFYIKDQEHTASDWRHAVITLEEHMEC